MASSACCYRKLYILFFFLSILFGLNQFNNSCNNYVSYLNTFFSADCYHSPDLEDDVVGIIRRHVGVSETHQVETEDGYILGLFRIPRMNPKGVILLQHPVCFDGRIFVAQYDQSIAFLFWRAGYDVWVGNGRGTFYSKKHRTMRSSESAFWNHRFVFFWDLANKKNSFHEMGYYDNHAMIEFIRGRTNGSRIIYLGYSLGANTGLVYASTRSEEAAKSVKIMIAIAPCTHLKEATTVFKYIAPFLFSVQHRFNVIDLHSTINRHYSWYLKLARITVKHLPFKKLVPYVISFLFGWTPEEFDPNFANMVVEKFGTETSLKLFDHVDQIYGSGGNFQRYDYGDEENLKLYGNRRPPLYPLESVKVPVFLVYGQNDSLSYPDDNEVLYRSLPEGAKLYGKLLVEGFNHVDFAFGKHRNERVYDKILQLIESIFGGQK